MRAALRYNLPFSLTNLPIPLQTSRLQHAIIFDELELSRSFHKGSEGTLHLERPNPPLFGTALLGTTLQHAIFFDKLELGGEFHEGSQGKLRLER